MSAILSSWIGFDNIKTLNPQWDEKKFDVLCLPENIETEKSANNLIESGEAIQLYKVLKGQGITVLDLHDLGIKIPIYERRCNEIYFGTLFIKEIALQIVLGIVSTWIADKLFNSTVHIKLKIQKSEQIVSIIYDGDPETLKQILNSMARSENDEHKKNG